MQTRTESIREALSVFIQEQKDYDLLQVANVFDLHSTQFLKDLRLALLSCNEQALALQQKGEKGETKFITFSFLDSSIITCTYDIRIDFYDYNFLSDISESCAYFSYRQLIPIYKESAKAVCAEADKHFARFMEYERNALMCSYKDDVLYKMVMDMCSLCLQHPEMTGFWPSLTLAKNCVFTFGRLFSDQQHLLNPLEKAVAI